MKQREPNMSEGHRDLVKRLYKHSGGSRDEDKAVARQSYAAEFKKVVKAANGSINEQYGKERARSPAEPA